MNSSPYRVLARKYRPHKFDDLVGQDVLVRTLSNAFSTGRIAHAFLLTGIRGIGKTTTARIIARGLNCIGPDGKGGPTTAPCGECPNCRMILEDRHVDIIEMDAASRTGVDDIRDIIDTVHYAPTSARYKIYIIDEVHMLSKNAFNALLKTLEEPPAHVKFIFATTELRKIPITIVSRCQRFDLKRLDVAMLAQHLANVCAKESVSADAESLSLIATAAEGSVRDALSLLDQTIAMSGLEDGKTILSPEQVRNMLGIADKSRLLELLELLFKGEAKTAIAALREHYEHGNDPHQLFQDMLSLLHYLTRIKVDASLVNNPSYSDMEQQSASQLAGQLSMANLTRAWQMTLKGIEEIKLAPHPLSAAEMILIRLCHAASLPSPDQLVKQLQSGAAVTADAPTPSRVSASATSAAALSTQPAMHGSLALAPSAQADTLPLVQTHAEPEKEGEPMAVPASFLEVVTLFKQHKEAVLYSHLYNNMRLVSFRPGHIEVVPTEHLSADIAARISRHLSDWCGKSWRLVFADAAQQGEPTLREQDLSARQTRLDYARAHPHIQKAKQLFGDVELLDVQPVNPSEDTP